jgi:hypothetical protein
MYIKNNPIAMNNFAKSAVEEESESPIFDTIIKYGQSKVNQLMKYGAEKIAEDAKKELPPRVKQYVDDLYYAIGGCAGLSLVLIISVIAYKAFIAVRSRLQTNRLRAYQQRDSLSNVTSSNVSQNSIDHFASIENTPVVKINPEFPNSRISSRNLSSYNMPISPVSEYNAGTNNESRTRPTTSKQALAMATNITDEIQPNKKKQSCQFCEGEYLSRGMRNHVKAAHIDHYDAWLEEYLSNK